MKTVALGMFFCAILLGSYPAFAVCNVPQPPGPGRVWELERAPEPGEHVVIKYDVKTPRPIRLVLFKNDELWWIMPAGEPPKELPYPGGTLGYRFEICQNDAWQYLNPWLPTFQDIPGGASFVLMPTDAGGDPSTASRVTMAWGTGIALPPPPLVGMYVVTLGNMTIWNGVCRGPRCTDTDYISLNVEGPDGQPWTRTFGPNNLHRGEQTNWALSSRPFPVPVNSTAKLKISWAAINKGHSANADSVKQALSSAADAIGKQVAQDHKNDATLVKLIVAGFQALVNWFGKDCDCALFEEGVVLDGAVLPVLQGQGGWSAEGPNQWHKVFDYLSIPSECDTGRYNLEVHIRRIDLDYKGPLLRTLAQ